MAPSQHAETMETIIALKRKIRRDKEGEASSEPIQSATNRYNKLKTGASYVRAGSLPWPRGPTGYKQPIEHAGYTRNILSRNPRRYNEYGDELEASDSDAEADADAQEENPYSGIRLEELLCPLKHPSELAIHPSLSVPYRDPALSDMVATTEERLRQERVNLWNAKALQRQLIGDESWMPLGRVETPDDWDLFEPKPKHATDATKKRKRDATGPVQNGTDAHNQTDNYAKGDLPIETDQRAKDAADGKVESDATKPDSSERPDEDVSMQETNTALDAGKTDSPPSTEDPKPNGLPRDDSDANHVNEGQSKSKEEEDVEHTSPPPPSRRITRALAAENDPNGDPLDAATPSTTTSIDSCLFQPDPVFLLPPHLIPPADYTARLAQIASQLHLPVDELLETRRLLTMYIQKQEESVRGYEAVLQKLLKAKHMKEQLWEWSKADGHVGEWSDGEDWIDAESWGLTEGELRKGRDEDELGAEERERERGGGGADGDRAGGGGSGGVSNGVAIGGSRVKGKGRRKRAAAAAATALTAANAAVADKDRDRDRDRDRDKGLAGGE